MKILIKYGELTTKKDNRNLFINQLKDNIKNKTKDYNVTITKDRSRMYLDFEDKYEKEIVNILKNTFGIHSFNIVYMVHTNTEDINNIILEKLNDLDFNTFKVNTKRRDKSFSIKSMDFNKIVASFILKNKEDISVDVHNPDIYINIEIEKEYTYIYFNEIKGLGGYPVGTLDKGLLMLSGGIDSPVAGYLSLKRGLKLDCLYFEAIPHTSMAAREKVITLARELLKYSSDFNLYIVPITKLEEEIYHKIDSTYMITILRRMMYRISEKFAEKTNSLVLINGESIGQVASQTLTSMNAINEVVKIPVIRPLACFDKLEIINISKKINTYETSILPYEDCCTIFVPKHPVINPKKDKCKYYESLIDYESLIKDSIDNTIKINITENEEFSDLL